MALLGQLSVLAAFACCGYALVASAVGAARGAGELVTSGRRAMLGAALLSSVAVGLLLFAFFAHDFSLAYVWKTSSRTTPPFYLATAIWGGQEGSLLFWSWMLATMTALALRLRWKADVALLPWFTAVCAFVCGFFLFLVAFVADPFQTLEVLPADGSGLNPLLQHPGMAFHPPTLYLGFTGMTIPFAFAMAALLAGRTDAAWIQASRRWTLVAWAFLTIGLALGGRWAYDVLGWGGYWGWDPVENAALMPWLAATAFLHSVMVQERRGMFRVWNMALIILTFCLVIIGTFLTRAGLVSSVHAFAQSDIGPYFLVFTAIVVLGSLGLLWWRLPLLRGGGRIESALSREAAFMANNVLFMGALFAVFWGTLFPLFSEIATGQRVTVGPSYFNKLVLPMGWALLLLMGFGVLLAWRRTERRALLRSLTGPALVTLGIVALLAGLGVRGPIALGGFGACAFALWVTAREILRGLRARIRRGEGPLVAAGRLFARQRRRYGGYVVHIGLALFAVGVTGNLYVETVERTLARGESLALGDYALTYRGLAGRSEPDVETVYARVAVSRGGQELGELGPSRQFFRQREEQPVTVPSILHRPLEDVYTLLGSYDTATEQITIKAQRNPLVSWVWIGLVVLVAGTLVAAWPDRAEARVLDAELRRLTDPALAPEASSP